MKTANIFVLIVLVVLFSTPAFAQLEKPPEPRLIAKPNPALADINSLMMVIIPSPPEPNTDGLVWSQLIETVSGKLNKAGIKIAAPVAGSLLEVPELRLNIDLLEFGDSQQYVFRVQTSFARKVLLGDGSETCIKADVFQTNPLIQLVPIHDMPEAVVNAVSQQADTFIAAWSVAKQLNKQTDVNNAGPQSGKAAVKKDTKSAKQQDADTKYVASKNGKVFHKASCQFAKRIKPENLVSYNTRDEAVKAGKNPCKTCNP
ncbi:MAG: Ada metal-binding domain-containing protein [Sedimentisphaerales bacterium]